MLKVSFFLLRESLLLMVVSVADVGFRNPRLLTHPYYGITLIQLLGLAKYLYHIETIRAEKCSWHRWSVSIGKG
jgi:hypothetical protein